MKNKYDLTLAIGFYVDCKLKQEPTSGICILKQGTREVKIPTTYPSHNTTMHKAQLDAIAGGLTTITNIDTKIDELNVVINFARPYLLKLSHHFLNMIEMRQQLNINNEEQMGLLVEGYLARLKRPLKYTEEITEISKLLLLLDSRCDFTIKFDNTFTTIVDNAMKMAKTTSLVSSVQIKDNVVEIAK